MPILRGYDGVIILLQGSDLGSDFIASFGTQGAAGAKVILNVNDNQSRLHAFRSLIA